jgi:hypothetical protein
MTIKEYYDSNTAVWRFLKKYLELLNNRNHSYFDDLVLEAKRIAEEHDNGEYINQMLVATINEIERVYLEKHEQDKNGK